MKYLRQHILEKNLSPSNFASCFFGASFLPCLYFDKVLSCSGMWFLSVAAAVTPIVQGNVVVKHIVDSPISITVTPIIDSLMIEINEEK
jgi:hypothetical protein